MGERAKKESNWTPPEVRCSGLHSYAQAIRECVNTRFIGRTLKVVQNITQAQLNAIHAPKTNRIIVIKPADRGGPSVILNRKDYCKEVYKQLNNQERYRQLPANQTKEHTGQFNRLVKSFDAVLLSTLRSLIPRTSRVGDFYCLPKIHKANRYGCPIISGKGPSLANIKGILKPIVQGTPSFCCDTTDFLQKLSTHGPVKPGTFFITIDVLALYISISHDDSIIATASVLNTNNCQVPDAILQLISFILDLNIFTFDNQFFIQTHGTAMQTRFAHQYANIFMHSTSWEHLTKIFPMPSLLDSKQPPNIKQTIVRSKLPSLQENIDHNTIITLS
eukprot:g33430.t1